MRNLALSIFLVGSVAATAVLAAPPAGAPSGTTGLCNDGSYSSSAEKKGACRGHKGVKEWFASSAEAPAATTTTTSSPPTAATTTTTRKTSTTSVGSPSAATAAQPGGGPGQVWANENTKVYHCSGDKWYGKTKHGEYMSETDAKAKGFHADHGKACG
jgi:hypothetical protein